MHLLAEFCNGESMFFLIVLSYPVKETGTFFFHNMLKEEKNPDKYKRTTPTPKQKHA